MNELLLYSGSDCELCEQAEALVRQVMQEPGQHDAAGQPAFQLTKVDINSDVALKEKYGWLIPVLARADCEEELHWPFPPSRVRAFLK